MTDYIVIGAGVAGLTAARILSAAGKSVVVLEARDRIGGRINTLEAGEFSDKVEEGAEFVHGELPHTIRLMQEAGVQYTHAEGSAWSVQNGQLQEGGFFNDDWGVVIEALKKLDHDMSIADFLEKYFGGDAHRLLRESITRFVQGYDAADTTLASTFALRDEWVSEGDFSSYHPMGGYHQLMEFLQKECVDKDTVFHLSSEVTAVHWRKGSVEVVTKAGAKYNASKVLITIPPAVLRSEAVHFAPALGAHGQAIHNIETGGVIKVLAEFKEPYWEQHAVDGLRAMPEAYFIFSDAFVPTWWTQRPSSMPLLTGWLAGPVTKQLTMDDNELIQKAKESLAYLFDCSVPVLEEKLRAIRIINWMNDPYARGAYAFRTLQTADAQEILSRPVEDTLYFAGEAYYNGPEMGTVEAALANGETVASRMLTER